MPIAARAGFARASAAQAANAQAWSLRERVTLSWRFSCPPRQPRRPHPFGRRSLPNPPFFVMRPCLAACSRTKKEGGSGPPRTGMGPWPSRAARRDGSGMTHFCLASGYRIEDLGGGRREPRAARIHSPTPLRPRPERTTLWRRAAQSQARHQAVAEELEDRAFRAQQPDLAGSLRRGRARGRVRAVRLVRARAQATPALRFVR